MVKNPKETIIDTAGEQMVAEEQLEIKPEEEDEDTFTLVDISRTERLIKVEDSSTIKSKNPTNTYEQIGISNDGGTVRLWINAGDQGWKKVQLS